MSSIVIVGAGNMGGALVRGLIAKNLAKQLTIIDPALKAPDARRFRAAGASIAKSPVEIKKPKVIIFAVKPQMMPSVVTLYASLARNALIISIAAGTSTHKISDWLTTSAVVRAMPNTPASIGKGITAIYATPQVTASQRSYAEKLMRSVGDVIWLDREESIDPVTAVSGSGPAYIFFMVEALAKAGVAVGLPPDAASKLARKMVEGAGALLAERKETAEALRRAVTSPGGTTEAALKILMSERGLEPLMRAAIEAATARGQELGK